MSAKQLRRGTAAAINIQKKKCIGSHVLIETLVIDNPSQNIKLTVVTCEKKQLNLTWNPRITFDEITTKYRTYENFPATIGSNGFCFYKYS